MVANLFRYGGRFQPLGRLWRAPQKLAIGGLKWRVCRVGSGDIGVENSVRANKKLDPPDLAACTRRAIIILVGGFTV
jgi:hypothetical protein